MRYTAVNKSSFAFRLRTTVMHGASDRSILREKTVPFRVYGLDSVPRLFI